MAELNPEQQTFIVQALARFMTPSQVAQAVKEEFEGLIVSRQAVRHYNPLQNPKLPDPWKALFVETRESFVRDVDAIAVKHKAFRLNKITELIEKAEEQGNYPLVAQLLIQAAKEDGDAYTNRRKLEVDPRQGLSELLGVSPEELPETPK